MKNHLLAKFKKKRVRSIRLSFGKKSFVFLYIHLQFFEQNIYSHQVLMYLNIPGIQSESKNRQIVEEQLDV